MTASGKVVIERAVKRLDREAKVHASGHQNVHARRYVLPRTGGDGVEIMIVVKGSDLQLWCEANALSRDTGFKLGGTFRPSGETYAQQSRNGNIVYGRHSGLKTMDRLHRGDAWRFVPQTVDALDRLIDAISGR